MSPRHIRGAKTDAIDLAQDPFARRKQGIYNPGMPWVHYLRLARWYEHKMRVEEWERDHGCSINIQPDGSTKYVSFKHHKIVRIGKS